MPSYYDLPAVFGNASVEDVNKFDTLPYYLVMNEVRQFPKWNIWDRMYGKIDWEPNMGDTMRGVTPQPSPLGETFFFPQAVTADPHKNIYETDSASTDASVKWHRYESKQFSFVPYFRSFWRDQIQYANTDLARQIQNSNNIFIRTNVWFQSPRVYLAGSGLVDAPTTLGNAALTTANSKTAAWLAVQLQQVKTNLSLRVIHNAQLVLREDINAPAFDKQENMPTDNAGLRQKYVLVGSTEAWDNFPFDPTTQLLKSINLDLMFEDFQGLLFGKVTYKFDGNPMRILVAADGTLTFPAKEVIGDDKRIYINPNYMNAQFEIAFLCGADAYKSIKVGPPPKEFTTQNMKASKFYGMRWNGEIQLTDQILIQRGTIAGSDLTYELNRYGTQLQMISQATHGILGGDTRYCLPIIYRRQRATEI